MYGMLGGLTGSSAARVFGEAELGEKKGKEPSLVVDKISFGRMADVGLATVKPLSDIVLQIYEAVNTVKQNKKDCLRIEQNARTYCDLVGALVRGTDITQDEDLRAKLEEAKGTFEEALKVVKKCQERHIFCHFFWGKGIADDLKNVLKDLKLKMQQANTCGIVYNAKSHHAATKDRAPPPPPPVEDDIEVVYGGFSRFTLPVLKKATNNFSDKNRIGEGSFSVVYMGELYDGRKVAVKDILPSYRLSKQMCIDEFIVGTKLEHRNVVSVLGYCIDIRMVFMESEGKHVMAEDSRNLLVLGYVPNGSLEQIVAGTLHIDWSKCFKIIKDIADGIHYIHKQRVIHLDIKPSNIHFNPNETPVIIDFGFSKVLEEGEDKILLADCVGTLGYIAPEYLYNRVASFKSDVYSFGITLLRILISWDVDANKKHNTTSEPEPWYSGEHWEGILKEAGGLKELLNPAVKFDESQIPEINMCVEVGRRCAELDAADRLSMEDVVNILSKRKMLPELKKTKPHGNPYPRRGEIKKKILRDWARGNSNFKTEEEAGDS